MHAKTITTTLTPLALKDAPALIETVFPAQKVSFEAQKERKANLGQTLTGLGSYWKGRKPLILVRAIVLGSLLPPTDDAEADLAIFEKLMAFDDEGLARRALAANAFSAAKLQELIPISDPERYFGGRGWRRDITDDDKLVLYRQALAKLPNYEEKAGISKRPEEVDQDWLCIPVWAEVNRHYAHLGVNVQSLPELVEQFGILRYGHRPRVGDTFSGGGSIPFEAARIGCDIYASDLNPVACMLTWGALNIIGSSPERRTEIEQAQERVAKAVDVEITKLGIEHDKQGNRAKSYLYCLEARCPETGWMIPLSPSWVISKGRNIVARLKPDHGNKRFDIEIVSSVSDKEAAAADQGTVQEGDMVYTLDGKTYRTPIKTLRGDYRNADGSTGNRLRRWEKSDFKPRPDDIFQERLYAIHWITKATLNKSRQETWFAAPTDADWERERRVGAIVAENLSHWQDEGLVPDMAIEPGDKTDELIRTRGWTHWHHLFNARQLLLISRYFQHRAPEDYVFNAKSLDWNSRISNWMNHWEKTNNVFYNQALNTFYNYGIRCFTSHEAGRSFGFANSPLPNIRSEIKCLDATTLKDNADVWITDPPYADAVNYHEITEFFIAWLRKNPPRPFDGWVWDSRRALAIKGSDDDFRRGMVSAYKAMAEHMPDNGMQCVMFTHQDTGVWGDLIGIFWAAGRSEVGPVRRRRGHTRRGRAHVHGRQDVLRPGQRLLGTAHRPLLHPAEASRRCGAAAEAGRCHGGDRGRERVAQGRPVPRVLAARTGRGDPQPWPFTMSPHHLILNPMIDTSHAGDFISSPSLAIRMRRAITLAWEIFGRKVGGGLIPVNKEASMQLQYAYVLKQLLPLILQHPDERADVELETGVQLEGERGRNNIDILVMGESLEGKTKIAIELKCYRDVTATGGKRGATDIFMKDVYVDLHILERYVEQGVADAGVALVMNDLRRLVKPSEKNGKAWAYDISDGFTFPGGRIAVDVGGKPVEVSLNRRYPFQWSQFGSLWFAEIEGLAVTSPPTPSGHVDSHHREDLLHTESDQA